VRREHRESAAYETRGQNQQRQLLDDLQRIQQQLMDNPAEYRVEQRTLSSAR